MTGAKLIDPPVPPRPPSDCEEPPRTPSTREDPLVLFTLPMRVLPVRTLPRPPLLPMFLRPLLPMFLRPLLPMFLAFVPVLMFLGPLFVPVLMFLGPLFVPVPMFLAFVPVLMFLAFVPVPMLRAFRSCFTGAGARRPNSPLKRLKKLRRGAAPGGPMFTRAGPALVPVFTRAGPALVPVFTRTGRTFGGTYGTI